LYLATVIRTLLITYYKAITVFLLIVITALSLYPLPELPAVPGKDKTLHLLAYAVLAFPVSFARPNAHIRIIIFFLLWSGMIEFVQPYVNRSREVEDLLANTIGLFLGYITGRLLDRWTETGK